MTAQLYCFGESGNAYKCALALEMTGTSWQPVHVDFFDGGTRTPEFHKLNPMGEVPVLVDGGEILTQSGLILQHIADRTGRLGGDSGAERKEIWRWILWDNHKLSTQIGTCRFLMNFLAPGKRPEGVAPFLQGRLKAACRVLDTHLQGSDWIVGQGPTIADLSCCSYLYYPEPFGFSRSEWPGIDRWLDRISALPGWRHPYEMMRRAFPGA